MYELGLGLLGLISNAGTVRDTILQEIKQQLKAKGGREAVRELPFLG